jgi:protein-disulfide isomerase
MDEQKSASIFDVLSPKQTFTVGLVGGVLVLCTIGFFILLSFFLKGDSFSFGGDNTNNDGTQPTVVVPTTGSGAKDVNQIASALKLNTKDFASCLTSTDAKTAVEADQTSGSAAGVQGTPHSIALLANGTGAVINGALPFEQVDALIAGLLKGEGATAIANLAPVGKDENITGAKNAKVTLIEYSDFQCPYCQRFHPTVKQVLAKYPNDVRVVYRHFPLESIHQFAKGYAIASECAAQQGKFWEFADALFQ